ncbi:MAG: exodeoxyribonuclease VII small subunit [Bacteroidales bacterium]|nr:exodeoxyribonuclease VII small subunit [Bacteroidales bacterium]
MAKKMTYKEALEALEKLVEVIENPDHPLDTIQEEVKQAMQLVDYCKKCLAGTEKELMDIIDNK